jgi:hypothetical protein
MVTKNDQRKEMKSNFEISCRRSGAFFKLNNLIKLPQFFKSLARSRCYWNLHDFYCLGISNFINILHYDSSDRAPTFFLLGILPFGVFAADRKAQKLLAEEL